VIRLAHPRSHGILAVIFTLGHTTKVAPLVTSRRSLPTSHHLAAVGGLEGSEDAAKLRNWTKSD
jgi:hypothetical protein